jgi:hypothetical protein
VPQKLPALKCFRTNRISGSPHQSMGMIPTYSLRQPRSPCSPIPAPLALFSGWVARGSAPPVAAAFGRGLTSAALVGAAIGRSAPRNVGSTNLTKEQRQEEADPVRNRVGAVASGFRRMMPSVSEHQADQPPDRPGDIDRHRGLVKDIYNPASFKCYAGHGHSSFVIQAWIAGPDQGFPAIHPLTRSTGYPRTPTL